MKEWFQKEKKKIKQTKPQTPRLKPGIHRIKATRRPSSGHRPRRAPQTPLKAPPRVLC